MLQRTQTHTEMDNQGHFCNQSTNYFSLLLYKKTPQNPMVYNNNSLLSLMILYDDPIYMSSCHLGSPMQLQSDDG